MRCSALETEVGAPICTTRSIEPMSIPSSSEDVATTARERDDVVQGGRQGRVTPWAVASLGTEDGHDVLHGDGVGGEAEGARPPPATVQPRNE